MSTTALPETPFEFAQQGDHDAPYTYSVPASGEVQPYTATATYDGTNASGPYEPTISIYSANGNLLGSVHPEGVTVAQGASALVTFMPPFGAASSGSSTGSGIQFDTAPQAGDWLYVETTGGDPGSPSDFGVDFEVGGDGAGLILHSFASGPGTPTDGGISITSDGPVGGVFVETSGGAGSGITLDCSSDDNIGLSLINSGTGAHTGIKLVSTSDGGIKTQSTHGTEIFDNSTGQGLVLQEAGDSFIALNTQLSPTAATNGVFVAINTSQVFTVGVGSGAVTSVFKVGSDGLAFFGHAQSPQQATPVTLADVIALLQAYGLSA